MPCTEGIKISKLKEWRFLETNIKSADLPYSKRMSYCQLTPIQQFFSPIMTRKSLFFNEMMMMSSLYEINNLTLKFLQYQLTETTVRGQTCRSTLTHYSDSEPTNLCSFSFMLCAQRRSNKYQFLSLWFDLTGVPIYDLLHSRRAR